MKMPESKEAMREQVRYAMHEKFGGYDAIEIEPLLDEALENVAGGQDICSLVFCSSSSQEKE